MDGFGSGRVHMVMGKLMVVFKPPLLLTNLDSDSKPILGPLFFNPKPKILSLLFFFSSLQNGAKDDDVLHESTGFECHILKIAVNPNPFPLLGNNHSTVGYLLASTLCSVHWLVVQEIHNFGSKVFKTSFVVYACWSPYIPEESVVLLESGALFLSLVLEQVGLPIPMRVLEGLSCLYRGVLIQVLQRIWHPRILIVARSNAIFLVDLRFDGCAVSCLAKVEM
ncbi:hypothetical protein CFP56_015741 [Quercus suber]|uniref:Uncharacterized protein n=1 Tax=Quercus suber TaxID=58331 RepID=A0AAW0KR64_QUESU